MAGREHLGELEHIVLLAVLRLGEYAYGVPIRLEIEQRTARSLTVGALYRTLDRLEAKGYVTSWFGDPTLSGAADQSGTSGRGPGDPARLLSPQLPEDPTAAAGRPSPRSKR
jgi:Transcriptional regulator PadR-like family